MSKFYKVRVSREMATQLFTEGTIFRGQYKIIRGLPSGVKLCNATFDGSEVVFLFVDPNPIYVDETIEVAIVVSRDEL